VLRIASPPAASVPLVCPSSSPPPPPPPPSSVTRACHVSGVSGGASSRVRCVLWPGCAQVRFAQGLVDWTGRRRVGWTSVTKPSGEVLLLLRGASIGMVRCVHTYTHTHTHILYNIISMMARRYLSILRHLEVTDFSTRHRLWVGSYSGVPVSASDRSTVFPSSPPLDAELLDGSGGSSARHRSPHRSPPDSARRRRAVSFQLPSGEHAVGGAAAEVSPFHRCIGSPCLRHCVHGAPISGSV
jgi:hypothetical protein